MTRRRLWPLLLMSGLGFLLLMALGVWQVQRLQWKNALIAEVEARLAEEPRSFAEVMALPQDDGAIAKVKVTGHFLPGIQRKIAVLKGGPGWEILQGFEMADGAPLLVSRGLAAEGQEVATPAGEMELQGLLRRHATRQGIFDPDNDPASGRWYTWDVPAMAQAVFPDGAPPGLEVLHLLPGSPGTEGLHVEPPKAELRNNHLGYAITWFGLAATLAVMAGLLAWQGRKQS